MYFAHLLISLLLLLKPSEQYSLDDAPDLIETIENSLKKFNFDLTPINSKLKFFNFQELENDLMHEILKHYNSSSEEIAKIIISSSENPQEIVNQINNIFQTDLFYIQNGYIKADIYKFNDILRTTIYKYLNILKKRNQIATYIIESIIRVKNATYYSSLKSLVEDINIPVNIIDNILQRGNELINDEITLEDYSFSNYFYDIISYFQSYDLKPFDNNLDFSENDVDNLNSIDYKFRSKRQVSNPTASNPILDPVFKFLNQQIKTWIHTFIAYLNRITNGYGASFLDFIQTFLDGLIRRLLPYADDNEEIGSYYLQ